MIRQGSLSVRLYGHIIPWRVFKAGEPRCKATDGKLVYCGIGDDVF